ncbi:hypothetical protein HDZ31DRAFT_47434, partial [Schizophyllum fasciatum]
YAKVRILPDGDELYASSMIRRGDDYREASYIKYDLLVDKHENNRRVTPEFEIRSFYGELQHIFLVQLPAAARKDLDCDDNDTAAVEEPVVLILASIHRCETTTVRPIPGPVYSAMGRQEVVDMTSLQCLVGRTRSPLGPGSEPWAIIDRSDAINRSYYIPDM